MYICIIFPRVSNSLIFLKPMISWDLKFSLHQLTSLHSRSPVSIHLISMTLGTKHFESIELAMYMYLLLCHYYFRFIFQAMNVQAFIPWHFKWIFWLQKDYISNYSFIFSMPTLAASDFTFQILAP